MSKPQMHRVARLTLPIDDNLILRSNFFRHIHNMEGKYFSHRALFVTFTSQLLDRKILSLNFFVTKLRQIKMNFLQNYQINFYYQSLSRQPSTCRRAFNTSNLDLVPCIGILIGRQCQKMLLDISNILLFL